MPSYIRCTGRSWLALAVGLAAAATACSSDNNNSAPLVATSITASAASQGQTGTVGSTLTQAATVQVTDQDGNPISNVAVTWMVIAGGGSVLNSASVTDANGDASTVWTLGSIAGVDTLEATIASGASVKIGALATAGAMTALVYVNGNGQSIVSGTTSAPLVVQANDIFGNPVANATINWATSGGTLSAATTMTGANGQASVTLTTVPPANAYTITATGNAISTVTFTLTGT
jgi:Bacterial Ig-like domain (group 1)